MGRGWTGFVQEPWRKDRVQKCDFGRLTVARRTFRRIRIRMQIKHFKCTTQTDSAAESGRVGEWKRGRRQPG